MISLIILFKIFLLKKVEGSNYNFNILRDIGDTIDYNEDNYVTYLIDLTRYSVGDNISYYYLNRYNNPHFHSYTYTYWSFLQTDDLEEISKMDLTILDNDFQTWDKEYRFTFQKISENDKMVYFRMNARDIFIKLYPVGQIINTNITLNIYQNISAFYRILKTDNYNFIILKINHPEKIVDLYGTHGYDKKRIGLYRIDLNKTKTDEISFLVENFNSSDNIEVEIIFYEKLNIQGHYLHDNITTTQRQVLELNTCDDLYQYFIYSSFEFYATVKLLKGNFEYYYFNNFTNNNIKINEIYPYLNLDFGNKMEKDEIKKYDYETMLSFKCNIPSILEIFIIFETPLNNLNEFYGKEGIVLNGKENITYKLNELGEIYLLPQNIDNIQSNLKFIFKNETYYLTDNKNRKIINYYYNISNGEQIESIYLENMLDNDCLIIFQCGYLNNSYSQIIEIDETNYENSVISKSFNIFIFPKNMFNKKIKIDITKIGYSSTIRAFLSPGYLQNNGYYELNKNNSIYKMDNKNVTFILDNLYYDMGDIKLNSDNNFYYFLYLQDASLYTLYNISFRLYDSSDFFETRNNILLKGKNIFEKIVKKSNLLIYINTCNSKDTNITIETSDNNILFEKKNIEQSSQVLEVFNSLNDNYTLNFIIFNEDEILIKYFYFNDFSNIKNNPQNLNDLNNRNLSIEIKTINYIKNTLIINFNKFIDTIEEENIIYNIIIKNNSDNMNNICYLNKIIEEYVMNISLNEINYNQTNEYIEIFKNPNKSENNIIIKNININNLINGTYYLNILAKQNNKYQLIGIYDTITFNISKPENKNNNDNNKDETKSYVWLIILIVIISMAIIIIVGFLIYRKIKKGTNNSITENSKQLCELGDFEKSLIK